MTFPFQKQFGRALAAFGEWALRAAERMLPKSEQYERRLTRWKQLWFVADVPLFIDSVSVAKLHDAVVRPEFEVISKRSWVSSTRTRGRSTEAKLAGEASIPTFLKGTASARYIGESSRSASEGKDLQHEANRSAEMRLEQLIRLYAHGFADRLYWTRDGIAGLESLDGAKRTWGEVERELGRPGPRPLIVLDLPPHTNMIPMAGETTSGAVVRIYQQLVSKLPRGHEIPKYPRSSDTGLASVYWEELNARFESRVGMEVVENSMSEGQRYEWIDYRVVAELPAKEASDREGTQDSQPNVLAVHLHFCPRGEYPAGTFAYQTIRRVAKHGLTIVGTLKTGYDINVLASYEK